MADTGWQAPGTTAGNRTITGADDNWSDPSNIAADDGNNTTVILLNPADSSFGLEATNFSFSGDIPAGSTIDGIEVQVGDYGRSGSIVWAVGRLILADDSDGTENKNTELLEPGLSVQTDEMGGPSDLWSEGSISRADVIDIDWGCFVGVQTVAAGGTCTVDFMFMKVYYTLMSVTDVANSGETPGSGTETWTDGDTGNVITGTGFV